MVLQGSIASEFLPVKSRRSSAATTLCWDLRCCGLFEVPDPNSQSALVNRCRASSRRRNWTRWSLWIRPSAR